MERDQAQVAKPGFRMTALQRTGYGSVRNAWVLQQEDRMMRQGLQAGIADARFAPGFLNALAAPLCGPQNFQQTEQCERKRKLAV